MRILNIDKSRWATMDGKHYYCISVEDFGAASIERIHDLIRREERRAYWRQWKKLSRLRALAEK